MRIHGRPSKGQDRNIVIITSTLQIHSTYIFQSAIVILLHIEFLPQLELILCNWSYVISLVLLLVGASFVSVWGFFSLRYSRGFDLFWVFSTTAPLSIILVVFFSVVRVSSPRWRVFWCSGGFQKQQVNSMSDHWREIGVTQEHSIFGPWPTVGLVVLAAHSTHLHRSRLASCCKFSDLFVKAIKSWH